MEGCDKVSTGMNSQFAIDMRFARHLLWVALGLFVMFQTFALVHDAFHGFLKHSHHGHACEVFEYCEGLVLDTPPAVAVFALLVLTVVAWPVYRPAAPRAVRVLLTRSRSPPFSV